MPDSLTVLATFWRKTLAQIRSLLILHALLSNKFPGSLSNIQTDIARLVSNPDQEYVYFIRSKYLTSLRISFTLLITSS